MSTAACTAAKVFLSDSDNGATSAKGSCGVDHDPESFRTDGRYELSIANWLKGVENKLESWWLVMPSTLHKWRLRELTVWGGATDLV